MLSRPVLLLALGMILSQLPLAVAEIAVSPVFGPGAVLQAGGPVPIFGSAPSGARVSVRLHDLQTETVADASGRWQVEFTGLAAGGPFDLEAREGAATTRSSVLVGDVWLLTGSPDLLGLATAAGAAAPAAPQATEAVRILSLPYRLADSPQATIEATWQTVAPDATGLPAAFARQLRQLAADRPVGVIVAASDVHNRSGGDMIDGDIVEAWAPPGVIDSLPWADALKKLFSDGSALRAQMRRFDEQRAAWKRRTGIQVPDALGEYDVWFYEKRVEASSATDIPPRMPSAKTLQGPSRVWNGMLAPLAPARFAGIVFVPGTGNLGNPRAVTTILERTIPSWRAHFARSDLPVVCLGVWSRARMGEGQLAWSELADALRPLAALPNVALVPFHGLDDMADAGSRPDTAMIATRLAPVAAGLATGTPAFTAPVIISATYGDGAAVLHVDRPLLLPADGTVLEGFTLWSPKTHWVWARGTVRDRSILVSHPAVSAPTAVRYGWWWNSDHPPTLVGPGGIPAPPYRSDAMTMCWSLLPQTGLQWATRHPPPPGESRLEQIDVFPVSDPTLPWVMTMGDSIHSGYKDAVRQKLAGVANLVQLTVPHTIKHALAGTRPLWGIRPGELAVLHINHGLHGDIDVPPEEYERQLDTYFSELREAVGRGVIIWAATTPVPSKQVGESLDPVANPGIVRINEVARRLALKHGFGFNDLYALLADDIDNLTVAKGNVHFKPAGNAILTDAVATAIQNALDAKPR